MNYRVEMGKLLAQMTLEQRLEMHAIEARNFPVNAEWVADILEDIETREYDRAIAKATGNYEPPDDTDAWSGGFASNH